MSGSVREVPAFHPRERPILQKSRRQSVRTTDDLVLTSRGIRFLGRVFPCSIGRGGLSAEKREGDGATPTGTLRIVGCLYRPDRLARPNAWALPIRLNDLWCDEPGSPHYNHPLRGPSATGHEALFRADPLYDLILLTDWNWPHAAPGEGSAIFLHQWRRPLHPTKGCIALDRQHLWHIATRTAPGARIVIPWARTAGWMGSTEYTRT